MKKVVFLIAAASMLPHLSGCSVASRISASNRVEEAKAANAGKQLVPKDGGTYLISIGAESVSYLGSGNTDWKVNDTSFTQPRGTYSIINVKPGTYNVYGNKRVAGGGEASAPISIKPSEVVCFYIYNPASSNPAKVESYKGDACDPFLRSLKQQNIVDNVN